MGKLKQVLVTVFLVTVLIWCSTSVVAAQESGKWWKSEVGRQLELTPKQVQDIEEIWAAHRKLLLDLRVELDKQQEALQELLSKSSIDEKLLKDQINRIVETRGKLLEANLMRNNKIRKVLTPEQRTKLIELRKQKSPPPKPTAPSNR